MKRILIATPLYPPDIGGPATYTQFLEQSLPSHGIASLTVAFSSVRMYPKIIRHICYTYRLIRELGACDCVYALDPVSVGMPSFIASRVCKKPLYLRVPGDYAWEQGRQRFGLTTTLDEYLESNHRPLLVRLLAWIQSVVARKAVRVVVPSEYMRGVVERWGVPSQNIVRIYSALHHRHIPMSKEMLRAKFQLTEFVVTTAARLVPWKGISVLIDTVCALRKNGYQCRLEIIGDGVLRADLELHIRNHDATSWIVLRGALSQEETMQRIKASDVFVLNTAYEGFSHQLLEAMSVGVPVVTTPVGGNLELIADEREGLLVPYNDGEALYGALARLYEDPLLGAVYKDYARAKVEQFNEDRIVHEVVSLFTGTSA